MVFHKKIKFKKNKHYVIISDWSYHGTHLNNIVGVYHSQRAARKALRQYVKQECWRQEALDENYTILKDDPDTFKAGELSRYEWNHLFAVIEEVKG